MYFCIMIPSFLCSQQRQNVPLLAVVVGINAVATGIRVGFLMEAPYDTKSFADPFYWYLGCLFAYCVFANLVLSCSKQVSNAPETNIEEFDSVEKRSLVNSKSRALPERYREPLLQIQIV
jgi:hypothetical protein